jgi:hypothetical protein
MAYRGRPLKMFTDKDEDWPIWEIDFEGWRAFGKASKDS